MYKLPRNYLALCGINNLVFTAHYARAASTSKANFTGLSEKEIPKGGCCNLKYT